MYRRIQTPWFEVLITFRFVQCVAFFYKAATVVIGVNVRKLYTV